MLSDAEITEIECIFLIIDSGVIPCDTAERFLEWLSHRNIERFALLNWMMRRWVKIRVNKYHLPTRIKKKICLNMSV